MDYVFFFNKLCGLHFFPKFLSWTVVEPTPLLIFFTNTY